MILLILAVQDLGQRTQELKEQVTRIRGLEFQRNVTVVVSERDDLHRFLLAEFERQFPRPRAKRTEQALAHFGLIPEGLDLFDSLIVLFEESMAGFYHPKTKELRLVAPGENPENRVSGEFAVDLSDSTLVHEFVHAAQDQNFDLRTLATGEETDDDLVAATKAMIEGDAFACGWKYLYARTFDDVIRPITQRYKSGQLPGKAGSLPPFLRLTAVFPQSYGCDFVLAVKKAHGGDWKALSTLFDDPPASTEQILHPERYCARRDPPTVLEIPSLGPEWSPIITNVHGEYTIRILLGEKAAEGWDGDRYRLFERAGKVSSVWYTTWDTEEDATEFLSAYREELDRKYPDATVRLSDALRIGLATGEGRGVLLERRSRDVLAIDGDTALQEAAPKIWERTKKEERSRVGRLRPGRWTCRDHAEVEQDLETGCSRCGNRLVPK